MLPPKEWISNVIRINSVTDKSNKKMIDFVLPLLRDSGLRTKLYPTKENGRVFYNLIAYSHSPNAKNLRVFHTHLDTVSPGDPKDWTKTGRDPFRATFRKNRVYGLGTADVKIDFLCKILAARQSRPWKFPIALVGTFGEERGLVGAYRLLREKNFRPSYALVGEPSELNIVYSHKGHMIVTVAFEGTKKRGATFRIIKKGKAAHSSTPHLGKNAILMALTESGRRGLFITDIRGGTNSNRVPDSCELVGILGGTGSEGIRTFCEKMAQSILKLKTRDARFSPSQNTFSPNQVWTEKGWHYLVFDVRLLPATRPEHVKKMILKNLKTCGGRLVELTVDAPLNGKKDSKLVRACLSSMRSLGIKPQLQTKASSTEAAVYHEAGAEAIVLGPGVSVGNVHRPNEFNLLDQIETATRFYETMMRSDWEN